MALFSNWKFLATLAVAIAGVVVPVWLWQADLNSKSLSIKLATRVPLQPVEKESLQGMEISVDGQRIESPYLVVLEITNDGSKPILASDFESPLVIRLSSDTYFVRARITNKTPKDIDTDISAEKTEISLKPALLNPKDSVSVTVVTAGVAPILETRARVAGIPSISIADNTIKKRNTARLIFLALAAALLAVASIVAYEGALSSKGVILRRRAAAFVALMSAFPSVLAFMTFLEELGITDFWYFFFYYMLMMIPMGLIASALNRNRSTIENAPSVGLGIKSCI